MKKTEILKKIFEVELDGTMQQEQTAITEVARKMKSQAHFEGSEKQVAWVEKIYAYFIHKAFALDYSVCAQMVKVVEKAAQEHTDAKWWIDHRDDSVCKLFKDEYEALTDAYDESGIDHLRGEEEAQAMEAFIRSTM